MSDFLVCPGCKKKITLSGHEYLCSHCHRSYPLKNGIVNFAGPGDPAGFERKMCDFLFKIEGRHFWHTGRKEMIGRMISWYAGRDLRKIRMLEIGCGNGNVMEHLKIKGVFVEGVDASAPALELCKKRTGAPLYRLNASDLPFSDDNYDVIGLFDVIEHIEDDGHLLEEACRVCKKGGVVVVTVPAYRAAWSYFDKLSGHKRRYEKNELEIKLKKAGFEVEKISFYMFFLFPVFWLTRKLNGGKRLEKDEPDKLAEMRPVPLVNDVFLILMKLENILLGFIDLPYGSSIICVARKN